jgi:hypothetical protein
VVGEDPLGEVLAVLSPALDGAVPGLEGPVVAGVLIGGRATRYRGELPDYVLKRMRHAFVVGGALQELADDRAAPPRDILRVGLTILSVPAELQERFGVDPPAGRLSGPRDASCPLRQRRVRRGGFNAAGRSTRA